MTQIRADQVVPSQTRYKVMNAYRHETLKAGDIVRLQKAPDYSYYLVREDYTLHNLADEFDNDVMLEPV